MVRLECSAHNFRISHRPISIPKWYDWSPYEKKDKAQPRLISIPKWYDWSPKTINNLIYNLLFQFLNGTIGVSSCVLFVGNCICISIPKWYDWSNSFSAYSKILGSFQFLNGMIGVRAY